MKDYIEYKGKTYQISTVEINRLFETMIFPVDNGVVSGYEIYCYKTSDLFMAEYKHQEIIHYPELFVSSEAKSKYLKDRENITSVKKNKTDYQQWKDWLDKWNVNYEEETWNPNKKELVVGGCYCQTSIVFDLEDNFICMTAYE